MKSTVCRELEASFDAAHLGCKVYIRLEINREHLGCKPINLNVLSIGIGAYIDALTKKNLQED